jgi:hypothetical protein
MDFSVINLELIATLLLLLLIGIGRRSRWYRSWRRRRSLRQTSRSPSADAW